MSLERKEISAFANFILRVQFSTFYNMIINALTTEKYRVDWRHSE